MMDNAYDRLKRYRHTRSQICSRLFTRLEEIGYNLFMEELEKKYQDIVGSAEVAYNEAKERAWAAYDLILDPAAKELEEAHKKGMRIKGNSLEKFCARPEYQDAWVEYNRAMHNVKS